MTFEYVGDGTGKVGCVGTDFLSRVNDDQTIFTWVWNRPPKGHLNVPFSTRIQNWTGHTNILFMGLLWQDGSTGGVSPFFFFFHQVGKLDGRGRDSEPADWYDSSAAGSRVWQEQWLRDEYM